MHLSSALIQLLHEPFADANEISFRSFEEVRTSVKALPYHE